jgi:hypothetical protein
MIRPSKINESLPNMTPYMMLLDVGATQKIKRKKDTTNTVT